MRTDFRKLYKERDDNLKTRLQRKLKIVEKLLKEEKIKHGLKKIDEKRKTPKHVEIKKVESEIIHVDLEEEIQIDEEHVVEEEENIIVPLEIEPTVDSKKKRKSRREEHESKTSEDGMKSKEKKKGKGEKSKSPVKSAKRGKSKSKSRSLSKSKSKSKKDKKVNKL